MTETPTKRITDEQAELAGDHWEHAMRLARKHAAKYPHLDFDWSSAAAFGLMDAAYTFVPELGFKFWTHARRRVAGAFIDLMRSERVCGYSRERRANQPRIYSMDGVPLTKGSPTDDFFANLHEITPSDDMPIGWEEQSVDFVYQLSRCLAGKAREIVRLYYCHGLTLKGAGERVGISESRAAFLHKHAIIRLREELSHETCDRRASA